MNLLELKNTVMHQTNNDAEDMGDFLPFLIDYLNEGYDKLVQAFCGRHVDEGSDDYAPLRHEKSRPALPDWTHRSIADWATWQCYRNGNAQKQNRGYAFCNAFEETVNKLRSMTDEEKGLLDKNGDSKAARSVRHFFNLPN